MTPEEWFEAHRRRQSEAEARRRDLLARAAARRAEARKRRAETKAAAVARMTAIHEHRHLPLGALLARMFRAERLRKAGRPLPEIKPNRRRRRPDVEDGGVPVRPDRPRNLTGGAAAELDFENE